ncbi:hypothetical protein [Streptomyces xiamenensis]|uniref:hypothetical protein n=1 Tax=Streptomyces xiamenensis TaxID=408015 RepID=UPI003D762149
MLYIVLALLGAIVYWLRYPGKPQHTFSPAFADDRAELKSLYRRHRAARGRLSAGQAKRSERAARAQAKYDAAVQQRKEHQNPKDEGEGEPLGPMRLFKHSVHVPSSPGINQEGEVTWTRVSLHDLDIDERHPDGDLMLILIPPHGDHVPAIIPRGSHSEKDLDLMALRLGNAIRAERVYRAGAWATEDARLSDVIEAARVELAAARDAEGYVSPEDEAAAKAAEADLEECRDRWKAMTGIRPTHLF